MDFLRKVFPFSFGTEEKSDMIKKIVIYAIGFVLLGIGLTVLGVIAGNLPFVGFALNIAGTLVEVYTAGGIVLTCLNYFKVIK